MRLLERHDRRAGEGFSQKAYISYGTVELDRSDICSNAVPIKDGWYVVLRSPFTERRDHINHNTFQTDKQIPCRWTILVRYRPTFKHAYSIRKAVTTIDNYWVPVDKGNGYD